MIPQNPEGGGKVHSIAAPGYGVAASLCAETWWDALAECYEVGVHVDCVARRLTRVGLELAQPVEGDAHGDKGAGPADDCRNRQANCFYPFTAGVERLPLSLSVFSLSSTSSRPTEVSCFAPNPASLPHPSANPDPAAGGVWFTGRASQAFCFASDSDVHRYSED